MNWMLEGVENKLYEQNLIEINNNNKYIRLCLLIGRELKEDPLSKKKEKIHKDISFYIYKTLRYPPGSVPPTKSKHQKYIH